MKLLSDGFEGLFLESCPRMPWGTRAYHFLGWLLLSNFLALMLLHATVALWSSPVPDAIRSYRLPPQTTSNLHYGRPPVGRYMNWGGLATGVLWVGVLAYEIVRNLGSRRPHAKGKIAARDDRVGVRSGREPYA